MRVLIIGGTGHIGSYLTPRLVEAGHEVINMSRSQRQPYVPHPAWQKIQQAVIDRAAEELSGSFGQRVAELKPEAVIDLTCYTLESTQQLVEALRGRVQHFLHCGTIWVHGPATEVPVTEDEARDTFGSYGCRKAAIEKYLLAEFRDNQFPVTILHPGHLAGVGWIPLNPTANFNPKIFTDLASGNEVRMPSLGRETVHHVHADDVAQAFVLGLQNRPQAVGESFHVVSPAAITLTGYAQAVAKWFGKEANLTFVCWEEWRKSVSEKEAEITWGHLARSSSCSIEKAQRLLGYRPRYRSLDAVREAVMSFLAGTSP
jgi:nucleoside-diphosphate-sugar epimerase